MLPDILRDSVLFILNELWVRAIVASIPLAAFKYSKAVKARPLYEKVAFALVIFVSSWVLMDRFADVLDESKGVCHPSSKVITRWITDGGLAVRALSSVEDKFLLEVSGESGMKILVGRDMEHSGRLVIRGAFALDKDANKYYESMPVSDRNNFTNTLRLLANSFILQHQGKGNPLTITMEETLLYDEPITKKELWTSVYKMFSALHSVHAVRDSLNLPQGDQHHDH